MIGCVSKGGSKKHVAVYMNSKGTANAYNNVCTLYMFTSRRMDIFLSFILEAS